MTARTMISVSQGWSIVFFVLPHRVMPTRKSPWWVSVLGKELNLHDIDDSMWALEPFAFDTLGVEGEIKLESKTDIQVGGKPAIKRIFSEAYILNKKKAGTLYVERILVISKRQVYHLYLNTISQSRFAEYQALMDQLVGTIQFMP